MQAGKERIMKTILKYVNHECYKSPEYLKQCEKHPNFRHLLPDHPEPPEELKRCAFCGGAGVPWFCCASCYGAPAYYIRCDGCGARTFPAAFGCSGLTISSDGSPTDWHTITEQEALAIACRTWNRREGA
jgi:hypothetical protein